MKAKLAPALADGLPGCAVIDVSGAVVSTVQPFWAGVGSTLPAASMARTRNVCAPSVSPERISGLVHATKLPPSSWHSNDAMPLPPGSEPVNEKATLALADGSVGWAVIAVSGAVVSISHV